MLCIAKENKSRFWLFTDLLRLYIASLIQRAQSVQTLSQLIKPNGSLHVLLCTHRQSRPQAQDVSTLAQNATW